MFIQFSSVFVTGHFQWKLITRTFLKLPVVDTQHRLISFGQAKRLNCSSEQSCGTSTATPSSGANSDPCWRPLAVRELTHKSQELANSQRHVQATKGHCTLVAALEEGISHGFPKPFVLWQLQSGAELQGLAFGTKMLQQPCWAVCLWGSTPFLRNGV